MNPLRLTSLRARLLAGVIGVVSALWLAAVAWTWIDAQHELAELLDAHLAQAAAMVVAPRADHDFDDEEALARAPTLHRYAPRVVFQVWHRHELVRRSGNAPLEPLSALRSGFETRRIEGHGWRVFAAPGAQPDMQIYVGEQTDARDEILGAMLRGLLMPMVVALVLLTLGGWWAVRLGLAPLTRLRHELERRQPQSLEALRLDGAPAEIAPMVNALNALFTRIDGLLESERRFTADAAHELRTPLAGIRAQAQVARAATQSAERDHALDALLAGCDRAARLVDQLLTLARLQAGAPVAMSQLDFSDLARQVAAEQSPMLLERGQTLELQADEPCLLTCEPTLMAVLLRNLLDNASRYGGAGATVRVSVAREGTDVLLTVDDSGPGLSDADLARLGERFFRVLGTGEGGSGLGWSIVQRIAQAHRGELRAARSERLGGLCVQAKLPG